MTAVTPEFKAAMIKKYFSLERAWEELDLNKDGVLQFHEFVRGCREVNFRGNLQRIFKELTGGREWEGDSKRYLAVR